MGKILHMKLHKARTVRTRADDQLPSPDAIAIEMGANARQAVYIITDSLIVRLRELEGLSDDEKTYVLAKFIDALNCTRRDIEQEIELND